MKTQDPKQPNLIGTYVRLERDLDERLDLLSDHRGMKAHIIKTVISKEIEYQENLKKLEAEQKAS
jgi:predicted DNA-binding protein